MDLGSRLNLPEDAKVVMGSHGRLMGRRVGFGKNPVLLVIDMTLAFTDAKSPLGGELETQIDAINELLDICRKKGVSIVFTTVYSDAKLNPAGVWTRKIPANRMLQEGSKWVEIDHRLRRKPGDTLLVKRYPSSFFGTDLASRLTSQRIDTIIVTGCTTSGCVRATVVDGIQHGFRPIIVEEGVGDRTSLSHYVSLFEMDQRYGDVVHMKRVVSYLTELPSKRD